MLLQSIAMSVYGPELPGPRRLTVSPFPVLAKSLDTISLNESRLPGLWLFVLLQLAEKLVQSVLVLPGHVVLEEVCDVEQQVDGNLPFIAEIEHWEVVGVTVDGELTVRQSQGWIGFG